MEFTPVNYTKVPILENLIDICRIKTFTWIQFLCKQEVLNNVEFYNPKQIYVDLKQCLTKIEIESFENEKEKENYYRLVLSYQKKYFVFKLVLEDLMSKNEKRQNNDYKFKNGYIYPEILYFYKKMKNEIYTNKFLISRFYCHVKALFYGVVSIQKICLIDRSRLQKIQNLSSSEYSTQVLNYNMMSYADITFIFFYHPILNTFENMYGFEYYNTNPVSLIAIDTRIKRPKKLTSIP